MTSAKKSILSFLILSFVFLSQVAIFNPLPVRADESLFESQTGISDIGRVYGGDKQDIRITIAKIITVALTLIGIIFLVLIIYAGFKYMTAAGNEEAAKKAMALLKDAIIGLIIILAAWMITRYMITILSKTIANDIDYTRYN